MGNPETKRFRSLEIDHKFKFGRLKYRQISRSLALPVAHQTTCVAEFAP